MEVTQGVQSLNNDVRFVAERPTFVRGHVRSLTGGQIDKVTAELIGTRDGVELGRVNPINTGGAVDVVIDPDRAQLDQSLLFELPASWRSGTVTLRMAGTSQPITCVDPAERSAADSVGADCTVTLTYETVPVLPITYVHTPSQARRPSPRAGGRFRAHGRSRRPQPTPRPRRASCWPACRSRLSTSRSTGR